LERERRGNDLDPSGRQSAARRRRRIEPVDPEHTLTLRSADGYWLWSFSLIAEGGSTRLIGRHRFRLPTLGAKLGILPMEPESLIVERRILLGIKERAEGPASRADDRPRP